MRVLGQRRRPRAVRRGNVWRRRTIGSTITRDPPIWPVRQFNGKAIAMSVTEPPEALNALIMSYKRGGTDLNSASGELARLMGLTPDIAAVFLKAMKRDNIRALMKPSSEPVAR